MTSIPAIPSPIRHFPDFPAEGRVGAIRNVATRLFYFTSIAIVFAFVLFLTTGAHP
jgi:hypothetical protein